MNPDQMNQDDAEYAAAFNEDMPQGAGPSEDEEFGLNPAAAAAPTGAEPPMDIAAAAEDSSAAAGEPAGQTATEAQGDVPGADEGEPRASDEMQGEVNGSAEGADSGAPGAVTDTAVDIDKERQRLKSWEGRLRKIEADLKAKADAESAGKPESNGPVADGTNTESQASEALEQVAEKAEAEGEAGLADAAEAVAEQVESGELTAAQAMKQLAEDFGEDFVKMIEVIASAKAKEAGASAAGDKFGEIGKAVDDIIADITDSKAKAHFGRIAAAHPDFNDIGQSQGFADYVDGLDEAAKEEAVRVASSGSADEIIRLLGAYKASQASAPAEEVAAADEPAADPVIDQATEQQMADAEGVRSSGMKLPEQPAAGATSYEDAWKEFS